MEYSEERYSESCEQIAWLNRGRKSLNILDVMRPKGCRGGRFEVFKLNNSDEYFLMYDLYRDKRFEFQRSTDLKKFSAEPGIFQVLQWC